MKLPLNRRHFLKTSASATVAAAAAGPLILRGAESPNARLRVAVMGVNGRGMAHISGFLAQPNVEIAYVCDVDSRTLPKAVEAVSKKQTKTARGVLDFREALDDPTVDALSIATPNHWHAPATILACQAGKHVYVEKPGSHNPQEAIWMVAAARKHDRRVQMGNQRRSWDWVQEAVAKVHAGEIGQVTFARTWYNNARPSIGMGKPVAVPDWLDFDAWQGPAPARPFKDNLVHYNWHWHWHWGNGELGNNGIHALDVARWGLQVDAPNSVTCGGGRYQFDDDQETPDIYRTTFDFGHCGISWESHSHQPYGTEGAQFGIQFYGNKGVLIIAGNGYRILDPNGKELHKFEGRWNDSDHFGNFVRAIRDGEKLTSEIGEGQKSTQMCHLGNIAWRTGRTLHLDGRSGRIRGPRLEDGLWEREYGRGWRRQLAG
ncbi:MAG TPA: dehydrogenase [Verrucomicrobiales bacterium]|nr:dehydrogenase [Verrucomicrobiales bacterium]